MIGIEWRDRLTFFRANYSGYFYFSFILRKRVFACSSFLLKSLHGAIVEDVRATEEVSNRPLHFLRP